MYADDTVIYTSDKSFSTIKSNLTENFALVATWFEVKQLILNLERGRQNACCSRRRNAQRTKHLT